MTCFLLSTAWCLRVVAYHSFASSLLAWVPLLATFAERRRFLARFPLTRPSQMPSYSGRQRSSLSFRLTPRPGFFLFGPPRLILLADARQLLCHLFRRSFPICTVKTYLGHAYDRLCRVDAESVGSFRNCSARKRKKKASKFVACASLATLSPACYFTIRLNTVCKNISTRISDRHLKADGALSCHRRIVPSRTSETGPLRAGPVEPSSTHRPVGIIQMSTTQEPSRRAILLMLSRCRPFAISFQTIRVNS